jgi:hypothetical protein
MTTHARDIDTLRGLAKRYAELAAEPVQDERRELWLAHFSYRATRIPVLVTYGMHNVWCQEVFGEAAMACEHPFYRGHERWLRMQLLHYSVGDDYILEPWIAQPATYETPSGVFGDAWGAPFHSHKTKTRGGAYKARPFLQHWEDVGKLAPPHHRIDERATARNVERLQEAVGDILEVDVDRRPVLHSFGADISTTVTALRGLDQLMLDMYDAPNELHALLAFLRDGILANQQEAEDAGDFTLITQYNQAVPYSEELGCPSSNAGPRKRKDLWGYCAAQEYTLISPDFHDEFLFQYQLPIMEHYGLVTYGCCENLTRKIDMLRQLSSLRCIAVAPSADLALCAEQIGTDYVMSWRPNPTDMVCAGWDEDRVRRVIRQGLEVSRGTHVHVCLKDIETVQGNLQRLARWTEIAREIAEEV